MLSPYPPPAAMPSWTARASKRSVSKPGSRIPGSTSVATSPLVSEAGRKWKNSFWNWGSTAPYSTKAKPEVFIQDMEKDLTAVARR